MYAEDHTKSRASDAKLVVKLIAPQRIQDCPAKLDAWNHICNDLASRQILSPSYIFSVTMLVDNVVSYNELLQALEDSGPVIPVMNKEGTEVVKYDKNPLFDMVKRTEVSIMKLCEKFGMNPRDAIWVTNPDLKTQPIETQAVTDRKAIKYFA